MIEKLEAKLELIRQIRLAIHTCTDVACVAEALRTIEGQIDIELAGMESSMKWKAVVDAWNVSGFSKVLSVNKSRQAALRIRLQDAFFRANWIEAISKIVPSNFCNGQNSRGWTATLDWFLQPNTVTKIMEGFYDNKETKIEMQAAKPLSAWECDNLIKEIEKAIADIKDNDKNKVYDANAGTRYLKPEALLEVKRLRTKIDELRKKKIDAI